MSTRPETPGAGWTRRRSPAPLAAVVLLCAAPAGAQFQYEPTSAYDAKGLGGPRPLTSSAPDERIDEFSGAVVLSHVDLELPGKGGLDLVLRRVYSSKIHRNYAAKASNNPDWIARGMQFVPPSPVGLGWSMHLGRLAGAAPGRNDQLPRARYWERPDGSQHPFFEQQGAGCEGTCLVSRGNDNLYFDADAGVWRVSTADGRVRTFGHRARAVDPVDPAAIYHYVTEIRDVHGNAIRVRYVDDPAHPYASHFIDEIEDSWGRVVDLQYGETSPGSGVLRLRRLVALGRTWTYRYDDRDNPWLPPSATVRAFLTEVVPPTGAGYRYAYAGLADGSCGRQADRWCELTRVVWPTGGEVTYRYEDRLFYPANPLGVMAVRALVERTQGGRDVPPATTTYTYHRGADYRGDDHAVVTRDDGSRVVSTFYGIGPEYHALGFAWRAGTLRQRRAYDADGTLLQTETFEWAPSPPIAQERWGDPWIGYDVDVRVPRLVRQVTTRGRLQWSVTHTDFNSFNHRPRCTVETFDSGDGTRPEARYQLRQYQQVFTRADGLQFRFLDRLAIDVISYQPFGDACDEAQSADVPLRDEDETVVNRYDDRGRLVRSAVNGVVTDYRYDDEGLLEAAITYRDGDVGDPRDGRCVTYRDHTPSGPGEVGFGARAPGCARADEVYRLQYDWNPDGTLERRRNASGQWYAYRYDNAGRRIREIPPPPVDGETPEAPRITDYLVEGDFEVGTRTTQAGVWTEERFDGFGRTIRRSTSADSHERMIYDALGRVVFVGLPSNAPGAGPGERRTYDGLGRVTRIERADGTTQTFQYGTRAHTVTVTETRDVGPARTTVRTLHAFGNPDEARLVGVRLPGQQETATYEHLAGGQPTRITYAGRTRTLSWDRGKNLVRQITPDGGRVWQGFDRAGNLRCRSLSCCGCGSGDLDAIDRADVAIYLDALGLTERRVLRHPQGFVEEQVFTHDGPLLTGVDDAVGTHRFDYTATERLRRRTDEIAGATYVTEYDYDGRGQLLRLTYPSGRVVRYGRADGRIREVIDETAARTIVQAATYHPDGSLRTLTLGNGVVVTLRQDPDGRRPDRTTVTGPGATLVDLDYRFDSAGNLRRIDDLLAPERSVELGYDLLDRLVSAQGPWGVRGFELGPAGDRDFVEVDGQRTDYVYDEDGVLQSLEGAAPATITRDPRTGGIASIEIPDGPSYFYTYDAEGRLAIVERAMPGQPVRETVVRYAWDGQGRLARTTRPGCLGDVVHHYDQGGQRIADSTAAGVFLREYVLLQGRTVAELDVRPVVFEPAAIDFGDVEVGTTATRPLRVTNRSRRQLEVRPPAELNWPFSAGTPFPIELPPGATVEIPVQLRPARRGDVSGRLTVCQRDGVALDVALRGRGVAATAEFDRAEIEGGEIPLGSEAEFEITVTSNGDLPLRIDGWETGQDGLTVSPAGPRVLEVGESETFTFRIDAANLCPGEYSALVRLRGNAWPEATVPVTWRVLGIEAEPTRLSFEPLEAGESATLSFELRNRASVPLRPAVDLHGGPQFTLGPLPALLEPDEVAVVEVTYTPDETPWSPFGDHASVAAASADCPVGCEARVHVRGNVEVGEPVPVAGRQAAIALRDGEVHVITADQRSDFFGTTNFLRYVWRDADGIWSEEEDPTGGSVFAVGPGLLATRGGLIVASWSEVYPVDGAAVRARPPGGEWGEICRIPDASVGHRVLVEMPDGGVRLFWNTDDGVWTGRVLDPDGTCTDRADAVLLGPGSAQDVAPLPAGGWAVVGGSGDPLGVFRFTEGPMAEGWVDETPDASDVWLDVRGAHVEVDDLGTWHIAWPRMRFGVDYNARATYVRRDAAGAWTDAVDLNWVRPTRDAGGTPLLAEPSGRVHVAFSDASCGEASRDVYFGTRDEGGWQLTVANPRDDVVYREGLEMAAGPDGYALLWEESPAGVDPRAAPVELRVARASFGPARCDDGDACTRGDRLLDGECVGAPYACADGNPCTDDACDGAGGCAFRAVPDGTPCPDGVCTAGVCGDGEAPDAGPSAPDDAAPRPEPDAAAPPAIEPDAGAVPGPDAGSPPEADAGPDLDAGAVPGPDAGSGPEADAARRAPDGTPPPDPDAGPAPDAAPRPEPDAAPRAPDAAPAPDAAGRTPPVDGGRAAAPANGGESESGGCASAGKGSTGPAGVLVLLALFLRRRPRAASDSSSLLDLPARARTSLDPESADRP